MNPTVVFLAVGGCVGVVVACSSNQSGGSDASGSVSFSQQVLPGFESACGLSSSCHQDPVANPTVNRVFLGCKSTNPNCIVSDAGPAVYSGLMAKSQEDPALSYVAPGDPTHSFILYKLQNNLAPLESQCTPVAMDPIVANAPSEPQPPQPCGAPMPLGGATLADFAAQVHDWIQQGAPNN